MANTPTANWLIWVQPRPETVDICGVTSNVITTPTDEQEHILQLLKIAI
jgi:hypothetical protein